MGHAKSAMIPVCRSCGKPVSPLAFSCPACGTGAPMVEDGFSAGSDIAERIIAKISDSPHATAIAIGLLVLIGLIAWAGLRFL